MRRSVSETRQHLIQCCNQCMCRRTAPWQQAETIIKDYLPLINARSKWFDNFIQFQKRMIPVILIDSTIFTMRIHIRKPPKCIVHIHKQKIDLEAKVRFSQVLAADPSATGRYLGRRDCMSCQGVEYPMLKDIDLKFGQMQGEPNINL